jgi:hypothetical protein
VFLSARGASVGHFCDNYTLHELFSSEEDLLQNLRSLLPASDGDIVVANENKFDEHSVYCLLFDLLGCR